MKCSQYNVKVFEIALEDPATFLQFLEANKSLLEQHLLSIHGEMDETVLAYLEKEQLHYVFNMRLPSARRGVQKFKLLVSEDEARLPKEVAEVREWLARYREGMERGGRSDLPRTESGKVSGETKTESVEEVAFTGGDDEASGVAPPLKIVKRPLRSGQTIDYEGSVLMTERINSGARVSALGSVVALGPVEGDISSLGECVIVPPITRGTLFFHGKKIENDVLVYSLNKITFTEDQIVIQPIDKKEKH